MVMGNLINTLYNILQEQSNRVTLKEQDSIEIKKYNDKDYDWFQEVFPLKMDRNKLLSVPDLYTIHYGDKGKAIIKLNGDRCHINTIAVRDDYKNSGVGSEILRSMINLCKSGGVKLITANVSENNIPSINLLVNSGFKQNEDVRDRFYDDGNQKLAYYLQEQFRETPRKNFLRQQTQDIIEYWQKELGITDWVITTERISPEQVDYNDATDFIGISRDFPNKTGIIYHDRDLYEEAIIHELVHVQHPSWSEEEVNAEMDRLMIEKPFLRVDS